MVNRIFYRFPGMEIFFSFLVVFGASPSSAQPEVTAWGNLEGIRVEGQLLEFETSFRVVGADWTRVAATGKERQSPRFSRENNIPTVETRIDSLFFKATFEDNGPGAATVNAEFRSRADTSLAGVYFCIRVPADEFAGARLDVIDPAPMTLEGPPPPGLNEYLRMPGNGVRIRAGQRWLEVNLPETGVILVKGETEADRDYYAVYVPLAGGKLFKGMISNKRFTVRTGGEIDKTPVAVSIDPLRPGRVWDGLGGNFRIQNVKVDPPVIDYCLNNLTVKWGRTDMPWMLWQPSDTINPIAEARKGNLHERVKMAMEMAQKLHRRGMPVILSAWFPPQWAIVGKKVFGRGPDGRFGNPLDTAKTQEIYASITDYILYLKETYGVEIDMFSFNESDLGIDVRQTDEEHLQLIKGLGAYFKSRGLKTKLLLGDTADANGYDFINKTMDDPDAWPFVGAISFHSWRGWADATLQKWADAAARMKLPLLVGEGSIDAGAWRYPNIFQEPSYAMDEIGLYIRILNICQPASILQWQLTSDYSVLAGGGVFRNDSEPLHPTQRFWNLKQLAGAPTGLKAIPAKCANKNISCAAMGDSEKGVYVVHIVNDGATRETTISGFPKGVKRVKVFVTDEKRAMEEGKKLKVENGSVTLPVDSRSFVTLIGE